MSNRSKDGCFPNVGQILIYILGALIYLSFRGTINIYEFRYKPPNLPKFYYDSIENIVINDFDINSFKNIRNPIFQKGKTYAVLNFTSPNNTRSGYLVSDIFASTIQKNGINIIERNELISLLNEQNIPINANSIDYIDKVKSLQTIDYLIFGNVTLYKSEEHKINLPVRIDSLTRHVYMQDYLAYKNQEQSRWETDEEIRKEFRSLNIFSLEELEMEYEKSPKVEYHQIFTVGISAKIIDVKSSKIVWIGQGETSDFSAFNAANRILNKFYNSIQSNKEH